MGFLAEKGCKRGSYKVVFESPVFGLFDTFLS